MTGTMTHDEIDAMAPGPEKVRARWENWHRRLTAKYLAEDWGKLAKEAGFDPVNTESAARQAFAYAAEKLKEKDAEISRLRAKLNNGE